jgi:putative hydrolase of the HAD superfamily
MPLWALLMTDAELRAKADTTVRAIMFDLSDVLVVGLTGVGEVLQGRLQYTPSEILAQLRSSAMRDFLLGSTTEDVYLRQVIQEFAWEIDLDELKQLIRSHFDQAIAGMPQIVDGLAGGYPLYLLSDHGREWIEHIEKKHAFLGRFTRRFYSFSLHLRKNDPATYRAVMPLIGCDPSECLFIDDRRTFLEAAGEVGLQTILFRDSRHLLYDLRRLGVMLPGPTSPPTVSS